MLPFPLCLNVHCYLHSTLISINLQVLEEAWNWKQDYISRNTTMTNITTEHAIAAIAEAARPARSLGSLRQ